MAETIESLRNIAFASHGGAGKTSLAETMLFNSGVIKRIGRVEDGNTVMDFEPEELKRNISLSSGFHQFNWKKHTISVIDTPGDQNFLSDTKSCMQAADSAVIVVDAVDGVKVQTEQAWGFAEEFQLPCIIFINKLDRERANFMRAFKDAVECFEPKPMIMQIPIGSETNFSGIVDLVGMKAYTFDTKGKATKIDIPSDMQDMVSEERETLVENVVESDDELLERYLEGESLSDDEIKGALKKGILSRSFAPVLCGSVAKNIGIELLQDFIVQCMPSPLDRGSWIAADATGDGEIECRPDPNAPFSGFVFKTVADPFAGRLSIFRIVSGTLGADGSFFNVNKDTNERYNQLLRLAGKEQKQITKAGPGAIVAVAKLKETTTGDTICNSSQKVKFKCADPLPPLISFAVNAKSKGDEDKVFTSLSKLLEEDMSLQLTRNPETKQILLSGLGQVHIEVTTERLKRKFNVEVQLDKPKVPYKETITKKVRVQGKHKKQTGGHGQYGDCWIQIEPLPRGK
ncbi:MAG: elongation factor G, partial [Deltaproteobacteria bacterium]|nr:elongation factor G [Deltaproteobacteria bacterium]